MSEVLNLTSLYSPAVPGGLGAAKQQIIRIHRYMVIIHKMHNIENKGKLIFFIFTKYNILKCTCPLKNLSTYKPLTNTIRNISPSMTAFAVS